MIKITTQINKDTAVFARSAVVNYLQILESNYDISVSTEQTREIKTALAEAVTNVFMHAYCSEEYNNRSQTVEIVLDELELEDKIALKVTVKDYGIGMTDVKKCMEPMYTTKGNEQRCGLGFTIMETMVDELKVHSLPTCTTTIILIKYFEKVEE
mgnify:CR=1 FL=1